MCRFGHCSVSSALEGQRLSIDVRLDSTGGPGVNAGYVSEAVLPSDVLLEKHNCARHLPHVTHV